VQLMSGDIRIDSTLGQGSVFSFDAVFETTEFIAKPVPSFTKKNQRVLIVDDHQPARKAIRDYLVTLGMTPEEAASGNEALALLRQASGHLPYDLVFLDEEMPQMSGSEMFNTLCGDPLIVPKPRVILLAPRQSREFVRVDDDNCFFAVLNKPVSLHPLATVLQELDSESTIRQSQDAAGITHDFTGYRVLLVEDNLFNQQVAVCVLENLGLEVLVADNGEEAVTMVVAQRFDAVFMDIQMPVMDGMEATRRIRRLAACENLPIIAMTAYATKEEAEKMIAAGMNSHIAKPIDFHVLEKTLSQWLEPKLSGGGSSPPLPTQRNSDAGGTTDTPVKDQTVPVASLVDLSLVLEELDKLLAALRLCKPKPCNIAIEQLHSLVLPNHMKGKIDKVKELIDRYEFVQAQQIVEAMRTMTVNMG
jgi:two-component system, sensor histidine kinase and response regulator